MNDKHKEEIMTDMAKIVSDAKASGYVPETVGKLLKLYECPKCGRKKAVVFHKDCHSITACPCGYRLREEKAQSPKGGGKVYDGRCGAFTKKGERCNNPPKPGSRFCGVHRNC